MEEKDRKWQEEKMQMQQQFRECMEMQQQLLQQMNQLRAERISPPTPSTCPPYFNWVSA